MSSFDPPRYATFMAPSLDTMDAKAIERFRINIQDEARKSMQRAMADIISQRDEILIAFIAKYGCEPNECIQIEQQTPYGRIWKVQRVPKQERIIDEFDDIVMGAG